MKWSLNLGKISGIQVYIHWTFLILLGWIVINVGGEGIHETLWSTAFILSSFVCVFLHELGHALAARRYGIGTRDITMLPIGGLARLETMPDNPKQEFVVAVAGPLVNVALAGVLTAIIYLLNREIAPMALSNIGFANFFNNLFWANIVLAVFNMIPAFPMDGGRVLRALLSFRLERTTATRIAASIGQLLAIGFVFLGLFHNPVLIFIGIFIFLGAQAESSYTQTQSLLHGAIVKDVIMHNYKTLDVADTIESAVKMLLDGQATDFLVLDNKAVAGTLSRSQMIKALSEQGNQTAVGAVMHADIPTLSPEMPLEKAYQLFQQEQYPLLPVLENEKVIGIIDLENVHEFIMIKGAQKEGGEILHQSDTSDGRYKYV
jgi:Zn-dependent protease/CBS domain-containing protein